MYRLLIPLVLALSSCAPKALSFLIDESAHFEDYQTYRLINTRIDRTNLSKEGRDILDVLEETIRAKMAERGYEESNLDPDLIMRYDIVTSQHSQTNYSASPFGPPVTTTNYMESLIIMDFTDTYHDKLFWQSSYDMRQESKSLKKEFATMEAVSEIFYTYPYRAGDSEPDEELGDHRAGRKQLKALKKQAKIDARQNR